ncbi:hypothetical protein IPM65_00875 [Candidatus Roizmanbacteria bacterium]|nr:MAG: hypothetical protein IPM65_00875 [Candidatus Roizmanbacteria bacterium]
MTANYTPLNVDEFERRFETKGLSNTLFIVIGILTVIVLGLIAYLLARQIL